MNLSKISFEGAKKKGINLTSILPVEFADKNLVVGVNATGKSRLINLISKFAKMISIGESELEGCINATFKWTNRPNISIKIGSSLYDPIAQQRKREFKIGKRTFREISDNKVSQQKSLKLHFQFEELVNGKPKKILDENNRIMLNEFMHEFKSWAKGVRVFRFANINPLSAYELRNNVNLQNEVLRVLINSSDKLKEKIVKDIRKVGYEILDLGAEEQFGAELRLWVKESKLMFPLNQSQLSQGMFRTILLITLLNYLGHEKSESMFLIDDFGEGLDYSRSQRMAKLVFHSDFSKKIHLLATSNDSFIMNSVSVRNWILLNRRGSKTINYSYSKNKKKFKAFEDTGLINFDLLSSNFLDLKV